MNYIEFNAINVYANLKKQIELVYLVNTQY